MNVLQKLTFILKNIHGVYFTLMGNHNEASHICVPFEASHICDASFFCKLGKKILFQLKNNLPNNQLIDVAPKPI
jgi:hypothetical protein